METPKPIKVSKKAIVEWVKKQPDDRKINMEETRHDAECGCIMVQYGKDHGIDFEDVGSRSWFKAGSSFVTAHFTDDYGVYGVVSVEKWNNITDFGKLKEHLGV